MEDDDAPRRSIVFNGFHSNFKSVSKDITEKSSALHTPIKRKSKWPETPSSSSMQFPHGLDDIRGRGNGKTKTKNKEPNVVIPTSKPILPLKRDTT